jgi:outer membrane biosynthesis protein TonB
MDANKNAIYAIYNRALRSNPALEGKMVFKIAIEPSGKVSEASVVSSELNDPALERKLLARIRLINFGAKDVLRTQLEYSFDFLPY